MNLSSNEVKTCGAGLNIITKEISSHLLQAIVETSPEIVNAIQNQTLNFYAKRITHHGLKNQALPAYFVQQEHADEIHNDVQSFILKHLVIDNLFNHISNKKLPMANHPRLTKMERTPEGNIRYYFDLSIATEIDLKEWKLFSFRAPKRKRYKDLDKQVDLFIDRELDGIKAQDKEIVEENDWVNFEALLIDEHQKSVLPLHNSSLWFRVGTRYIERPFHSLFLGKKCGDVFCANSIPLNQEMRDNITESNQFLITIKSITKGSFLSGEALKNIFRLKNKNDLHTKLIEIFSYRNDISQRRATIEEVFHLLFSKHRFEVPKHFTIRKQDLLLNSLKRQPDYQVYKQQKDFGERVAQLAEKLLKEEILIDQIAYRENIRANRKDIRYYLTFFNNYRLKEFIYFKPSFEILEESESPIHESFLRLAVQREKTLNHIIYSLIS